MSSRYVNDRTLRGGSQKASPRAARILRAAVRSGRVNTRIVVLGQDNRLDIIAYQYLGDPTLWWTIAVLSNIGWAMQLPPGTRLVVPHSREQIEAIF